MQTAVVVWDPTGVLALGEVVETEHRIYKATRSGVVLLPVDPDILHAPSAVAGYVHHHYGSGRVYQRGAGERGCLALLYAHTERSYLHWAARVEPIDEPTAELAQGGTFRLAADSAQPGAMAGGLSASDEAKRIAGRPDDRGGWTLCGVSRLSVNKEGYLGLCLYAVARGCRVRWLAVTQSSQPAL